MPDVRAAFGSAIMRALSRPVPAPLAPTPSQVSPSARAAVKRCCTAWQRAFDAHMAQIDNDPSRFTAKLQAQEAYRHAMPPLVGRNGVRDFLACMAHGILIEAIPREQAGHLLYAAQIALGVALREPKIDLPSPTPRRKTPASHPEIHGNS